MGKAKSFDPGEVVEVQRDTHKPWERATYDERVEEMKGWHRVTLDPASKPRYIVRLTGIELDQPTAETLETWALFVPSQRVRKVKA